MLTDPVRTAVGGGAEPLDLGTGVGKDFGDLQIVVRSLLTVGLVLPVGDGRQEIFLEPNGRLLLGVVQNGNSQGVIETVKKFGWPPDIVACHGWMTSLIPFYLRTAYSTEPLFQDSKIVYSLYQDGAEDALGEDFAMKASINALQEEDLAPFMNDDQPDVHAGALKYADAVIKGTEELNEHNTALIAEAGIPVLDVQGEEAPAASLEFYHSLLEQEEAVK